MPEPLLILYDELHRNTDEPDDVAHIVCDCDDNRTLCGLDGTGMHWLEVDELPDCVVCLDLDDFDCDRCGS